MNTSVTTVRRGLFGMFAGGLLAFGSAAIIALRFSISSTDQTTP